MIWPVSTLWVSFLGRQLIGHHLAALGLSFTVMTMHRSTQSGFGLPRTFSRADRGSWGGAAGGRDACAAETDSLKPVNGGLFLRAARTRLVRIPCAPGKGFGGYHPHLTRVLSAHTQQEAILG